jgi:hypothetical protein
MSEVGNIVVCPFGFDHPYCARELFLFDPPYHFIVITEHSYVGWVSYRDQSKQTLLNGWAAILSVFVNYRPYT